MNRTSGEVPDAGDLQGKDWPEPGEAQGGTDHAARPLCWRHPWPSSTSGSRRKHARHLHSGQRPDEKAPTPAAFRQAPAPPRIKRDVYEGGDREPFIAADQPHSTQLPSANIAFLGLPPDGHGVSSIGGTPMSPSPATDGIHSCHSVGKTDPAKQHDYFYWNSRGRFHQSLLLPKENWKAVRHGLECAN